MSGQAGEKADVAAGATDTTSAMSGGPREKAGERLDAMAEKSANGTGAAEGAGAAGGTDGRDESSEPDAAARSAAGARARGRPFGGRVIVEAEPASADDPVAVDPTRIGGALFVQRVVDGGGGSCCARPVSTFGSSSPPG